MGIHKRFYIFLLAISFAFFALFIKVPHTLADQYVNGYFRSNGTYVEPYWRSDPDGNPFNNYSYPGNYNPYTKQIAPGNPNTYLYDHGYSNYGDTYSNSYDYYGNNDYYTPSYDNNYDYNYDNSYGDYNYDNSGY